MKKRLLSFTLALTICLSLPIFAVETVAYTLTIDGITITATPDGTINYSGSGVFMESHAISGIELLGATVGGLDKFSFGNKTVSINIGPDICLPDETPLENLLSLFCSFGMSTIVNSEPRAPKVGEFFDVTMTDYFAPSVIWAMERKITFGTSATTFSPNENCTVAQILTFLWRAVSNNYNADWDSPFSNIKSSDYYYDAALWAYMKDMVPGGTFDGNKPCTRSMAVTYMWKAAGSPSAQIQTSFTDVPTDADYAQAVAWAVEKGIISTNETTFSPDQTCTREQIITFLYQM